jgi:hypothetical protein
MTFWVQSHRGDPLGYAMYRRHYSSKKNRHPKQRQFVGPGGPLVLVGFFCEALFVWRKEKLEYRLDGQAGVNCAVFRNESPHRSSDMILEAMDWCWQKWPGERLFTMIDAGEIRSTNPGYCFLKAGWTRCGETKKGLKILECFPCRKELTA